MLISCCHPLLIDAHTLSDDAFGFFPGSLSLDTPDGVPPSIFVVDWHARCAVHIPTLLAPSALLSDHLDLTVVDVRHYGRPLVCRPVRDLQ